MLKPQCWIYSGEAAWSKLLMFILVQPGILKVLCYESAGVYTNIANDEFSSSMPFLSSSVVTHCHHQVVGPEQRFEPLWTSLHRYSAISEIMWKFFKKHSADLIYCSWACRGSYFSLTGKGGWWWWFLRSMRPENVDLATVYSSAYCFLASAALK